MAPAMCRDMPSSAPSHSLSTRRRAVYVVLHVMCMVLEADHVHALVVPMRGTLVIGARNSHTGIW